MIEPGAKNFFHRMTWLVILFGVLTFMFQVWNLPIRDLAQSEGFYAAVASEMDSARPMSIAHGVAIKNQYFLYPYVCAFLKSHLPFDLTVILRYTNFFFLGATALLLALGAGVTRDFKAGLIAPAMFCANLYIFFLSQTAGPQMMGLFFLFAAQSAWIYFGFVKGHWNISWVISLTLVSCGFLTSGVKIPVYFFLPLFFLHRPLKLSSKINNKGFVLGMIILGAGVLCLTLPFLLYAREYTWDYISADYRGMSNFLLNILLSPLYMILLIMPWPLLIWIPFCAAIRPLEKTPIYNHYFRVVFITDFIVILFNPFSTMGDFVFVLPSLVLLCAITYDTAVRRYSVEMRRLTTVCGYITAFLAAGLIIYCFCPYENLVKYVNLMPLNNGKEHIFSAILAFLVLSVWIYHYRRNGQLWLIMLFTGCAIAFFARLTVIPTLNNDRSRSMLGKAICDAMTSDNAPDTAIIYKNDILDLYNETYYTGRTIRKINNLANIDKKEPAIYLLTPEFPQYPERTWKNLYETTYRGRKLYLFRGDIAKRKEFINRRNLMRTNTETGHEQQ